jgi:hypothetical protein
VIDHIKQVEFEIESLLQHTSDAEFANFKQKKESPNVKLSLKNGNMQVSVDGNPITASFVKMHIIFERNCMQHAAIAEERSNYRDKNQSKKAYLLQADFTVHNQTDQTRLIEHVIDVCAYLFQKYTLSMTLPKIVDYRLSMLLRHLLWFELFAIFSPQDIKVSLPTLLTYANMGIFGIFVAPCGKLANCYFEIE